MAAKATSTEAIVASASGSCTALAEGLNIADSSDVSAAPTEQPSPPPAVVAPPPAVEAFFSLLPTLCRRDYAVTLADYTRRFDVSDGPLPCFPPPMVASLGLPRHRGGEVMPSSHAIPFVSSQTGSLPRGTPNDVHEAVGTYLVGGSSKAAPNIDVEFEPSCCASNGEARRVLAGAAARGQSFWAAVHVGGLTDVVASHSRAGARV